LEILYLVKIIPSLVPIKRISSPPPSLPGNTCPVPSTSALHNYGCFPSSLPASGVGIITESKKYIIIV